MLNLLSCNIIISVRIAIRPAIINVQIARKASIFKACIYTGPFIILPWDRGVMG